MRWTRKLRLRLRSLFRSRSVEQELSEELRYHLERLIDNHIVGGLSPDDARYTALREMGAMELRKEECRDARGLRLMVLGAAAAQVSETTAPVHGTPDLRSLRLLDHCREKERQICLLPLHRVQGRLR
jgi:hypothetical protein